MSTEGTSLPRHKSSRWLLVLVVLLVGIVIGVALDRFALPYGWGTSEGTKNPNVTKDNYVKIKPDMSFWEVNDSLGSGEVVVEEGFIVDAAGRFKKYSRQGGSYDEQTGTVSAHDGKPSQEIKQEVVWRNGDKAIYVTFLNNKVTSKREQVLYNCAD